MADCLVARRAALPGGVLIASFHVNVCPRKTITWSGRPTQRFGRVGLSFCGEVFLALSFTREVHLSTVWARSEARRVGLTAGTAGCSLASLGIALAGPGWEARFFGIHTQNLGPLESEGAVRNEVR